MATLHLSIIYGDNIIQETVSDGETVLSLKDSLSNKLKISAQTIYLHYSGMLLDDNHLLKNYAIYDNSSIYMTIIPYGKMMIHLIYSGNRDKLIVNQNCSMEEFRKIVSHQTGISSKNQILIHSHKLMTNDSLDKQKVLNDSVIMLDIRLFPKTTI
jgi:hypothetical protein